MIKSLFGKIIPASVKIRARNFFLRGNNVECNLCGHTFVTFLPFGSVPRANAICPNCSSLERARAYWLYLQKKDILTRPGKLLHVAPEKQLFMQFSKRKNIDYHPVDKFAPGYVYPSGTVEMDVTDLKFDDNFFDFILCSHVLEHVPDDNKGIRELYRVLRPGGEGIIQVPIDESKEKTFEDPTIIDPKTRQMIFGETDHLRNYGKDYVDKLKAAGFEVILEDFCKKMDIASRFRYGLIEENIYTVRKPRKA